jgi:uncharacterized protein (DUF1919 family)
VENNKESDWIAGNYVPNLVSVIIPTYNRDVYLVEAIQSVINQTYRPIECIVVDDGSTDNTKETIDNLITENKEGFSLKYIFQENSGSQVARNTGTKASTGELIQYLDSDDLLYPDKIKNQVQFLNQNQRCDGVWGDWRKGKVDKNVLIQSFAKEDLLTQLLTEDCIHTLSFLFRRSIVQKIGLWDLNIKRNQEIDFQVRGLLKGGNYEYQSQICGLWRVHGGERIANTSGLRDILYFFQKWENILTKKDLFTEHIQKNISNIYWWFCLSENIRSKKGLFKMLMEAVRLNPQIEFINTSKMRSLRNLIGLKYSIKIWLAKQMFSHQFHKLPSYGFRNFYRNLLTLYFKKKVGDSKFCIISNDCWGAEMYKLLNKPFNTPFIGLMLMGPCYIKMLENPYYYLNLTLNFADQSKYPEMQEIKSGKNFPLGILGDSEIEIHFLHYESKSEAKEKWERRIKRMDWNNLFIKYDCGKDYASKELVEKFIKLQYPNKLLFGKENFGCANVIVIKDYPFNAVKQFRSCFLNFSPVGWLKGQTFYKNRLEKRIGKLAFKYL